MKKAFTLIELLVVIAIIAILAAILFPVFSQAKAAAKQSACLSNMRQIGMATMIYMQDFDFVYPQSKQTDGQPQVDDYTGSIENPDNGSIFAKILPYTGHGSSSSEDVMFQQKLFACPTDQNPFDITCPDVLNIGGPHVISYLINGYFVWGLSESGVDQPADTIEYGERRSAVAPHGAAPYCDDIFHPWFNATNPNVAPGNSNLLIDEMNETAGAVATSRHNVGANYTFAEGHAKYYRWTQVFSIPAKVDKFSPSSADKDF